ncbi:MAG: radical SAM protein [Abitibacteriaceae bacterium]|nr:radical SAM protein [Abditibacteriaceae bacterium]
MKRKIVQDNIAASCYFRSSVDPPNRKALLQVTERCNLFCAHCFVSAGNFGATMSLESIQRTIIPRFIESRVVSVTLTGGEPFAHPEIVEIVKLLRDASIKVSICSNATLITLEQMRDLVSIGDIQINVSLDGFRPESHGKFRGNRQSFFKTIETIEQLGQMGLLKGLLVTPNSLADIQEYEEICDFAAKNNATYVLMNPLSNMGRGTKSVKKLGSPSQIMNEIRERTDSYKDQVELVNIRFPNGSLPLASCEAGNIIYVFAGGDLTVCPYLIFAARTPDSQHSAGEFIVGNILTDSNIAELLDGYKLHKRYNLGSNVTCNGCSMNLRCGKGCPAAVIASGQRIEEVDREMCSVVNDF